MKALILSLLFFYHGETCTHDCKLSHGGVIALENLEGYSPIPYRDVGGKWTIGSGHLIKEGEKFDFLSPGDAEELLIKDAKIAENAINKTVKRRKKQNQFDATVSIVYNVGVGAKGKKDGIIVLKNGNPSGLIKKVADNKDPTEEFLKWSHVGKKKIKGLEARREIESNLYNL